MKKHDLVKHASILFLAVFILWAGATVATAAGQLLSQSEQLQDVLEKSVIKNKVPGAVAAVKSPEGDIWKGAAGWADLDRRIPIEPEMYIRIGSVSKSMTASLFLTLVDRNLAGLDDPIDKYLPGKVNRGKDVTLRNLLQMRSGLGHYEKNPEFNIFFDTEPRRVFSPLDLLNYADLRVAAPGTVFDYNNINYVLMGLVIEKITGQKYEEAIRNTVFLPLKMTRSSSPVKVEMPVPAVHGYLYEKGQVVDRTTHWDTSAFWSTGGVVSTLDDMLIWTDALMKGTLLTPESHRAQFDFIPVGRDPEEGYGLGVGRKHDRIGHAGNYNGLYTSEIFQIKGYNIVVLSNGQAAGGDESSTASSVMEDMIEALKKCGLI